MLTPTELLEHVRFGTPVYVYDLAEVRANIRHLVANLPLQSRLMYSLKANPHPDVIRVAAEEGCGLEASSLGELAAALRAAPTSGDVLYTGPAKRREDIRAALTLGCRRVSVESLAELARLIEEARDAVRRVDVLLRVNISLPDDVTPSIRMGGVGSRFGIDQDFLVEGLADVAGSAGPISIQGLHFFLASNVRDVSDLLSIHRRALQVAAELKELGHDVSVLDLGGGFGAPFAVPGSKWSLDDFRDQIESSLDEYHRGWRSGSPALIFEAGRYVAGTAGWLLSQVVEVKGSGDARVIILDSGIHHLGGMSALGRTLPAEIRPVALSARADADAQHASVVGPLCTPLDRWARGAVLPLVEPGDFLAVPNVGAYGLTASLVSFLSHPAPVEVAVEGGAVVSASRVSVGREPVLDYAPGFGPGGSHD